MAKEKIGDSPATVVAVRDSGMTLFGSDNPEEVIHRASKVAKTLKKVVDGQKMFTMIGQGKHLRVEAWQTLGAMTGVFAVVEWTKKLENGWEARVRAQTRSGDVVGAAEAECLNTERNWGGSKEDHALKSMAQTRAVSKALSMPLRFIVALAGYEGTPAEEMPTTPAEPRPSDSIRRPEQRKDKGADPAPKSEAPAKAAPVSDPGVSGRWTGLVEIVTVREYDKKDRQGKPTGEKGKLFSIKGQDGKVLKTFSETFAQDCKFASENGEMMTIEYTEKEFRGVVEYNVTTCVPAALAERTEGDLAAGEGAESAGPETEV